MYQIHELSNRLTTYLNGEDELDTVREYVTFWLGDVNDQLLNETSLEIWHFEDGLIEEKELRTRLASALAEYQETSLLAAE